MTTEESYAWCRGVARARARNFYYSFLLLPRPKRDAICAVYAFLRACDDLTDEPGATAVALAQWRARLDQALAGQPPPDPLWPAFVDAVRRYRIPVQYFHQAIDGVASDLTPRAFDRFEDLYDYCYNVASVVGLVVIHVFGFESDRAIGLAEKCGVAFQLTNILRDIGDDARMGRVYLPAEDLRRFSLDDFGRAACDRPQELERDPRFVALLEFEAARTRSYYRDSWPLVELVDPSCRAALRALIGIYAQLLERIEASRFRVLSQRVRLPVWRKAAIAARAALGKKSPG